MNALIEKASAHGIPLDPNPDPTPSERSPSGSATLEDYEKCEKAHRYLRRAVELSPQDAYLWLNKGLALCCLERWEEGYSDIKKATDISPSLGLAWWRLGQLCMTMDRFEEGISAVAKAAGLGIPSALRFIEKVKDEREHTSE